MERYGQLLQKGRIQRRMVTRTNVGLVLTEKQAIVMFPQIKGMIDMNFIFCNVISLNNGLFHEWCHDFFIDIWHNANTYDPYKLKKV